MQNPYAAPQQADSPIPESVFFQKLARLSWVLPLSCLAFSIFMNTVLRETPMMGLIGGLVFFAGTIVGGILAVVALLAAIKYRRVIKHAVAGLVTTTLLAVLIVGSLLAVQAAREAARRARPQQGQSPPNTPNRNPSPRRP
jgi:hypothetical protein